MSNFMTPDYHIEIDWVNRSFLFDITKIYMSNAPLNSLQLSTFLTVAESGGVLPAARRLNLSQPAVSARIQQLEESLGTALFLRSPRGMKLTANGNHLLDYARRAAELLTEAANAMQADAAAPAEPLTLAASTTPATYVLPALLARHRAAASPDAPGGRPAG